MNANTTHIATTAAVPKPICTDTAQDPLPEHACPLAEHGELLTVAEAARYLKVSLTTMYNLLWDRRVPSFRPANTYRIRAEDLVQYLESTKV